MNNRTTKEELLNGTFPCMTVGRLLDFIQENNVPREAIVLCERVEDVYFEEHGWKVYEKVNDNGDTEYHKMWGPVLYRGDEKDFLFLDAHY